MANKRTISRLSLPEVIADDLRERILSGQIGEGEKIRQEILAEEYDVSRMPIREALKRLSAEGLVNMVTNRGASVTIHSLSEIEEIFDLRVLIEVDLFRRAIPNINSKNVKECDALLHEMDISYQQDDVSAWGILNHRFHSALYSAADRQLTNDLLQRVSVQSDRYVRMHLSVMRQREPAKTDHHRLLALAKVGDTEGGCALLTEHIQKTKSQLVNLIAARRSE